MLFIFDWDGTLSDSANKIICCMQNAAQDADLEILSDDTIRNIIGLGLPEALLVLYPSASDVQREAVRLGYSRHFQQQDLEPSPFFPSAMETLQSLRDQGNLLAVATGKSRRGLDRVLSNLGLTEFFHSTRCADETTSKPHPQMLTELLEEFSLTADQAVMIGDTEYDMAMAHEIGMHKIAVSYGAHHIDRLRAYQPLMCVDRLDQILAWRNQIFKVSR